MKSIKFQYAIKKIIFGIIVLLIGVLEIKAQKVNSWITAADQSALLQPQLAVTISSNTSPATISVSTSTTYQTIDGFGYCLTEGSAQAINNLNSSQQTTLLNELFSTTSGLGVSVLRISIGASDMSASDYSYDDSGTDPSLTNFSLSGPDLTNVIPLIKKILLINPNIKILATPWSAPTWMKTNNAWIGGSLNTAYYAAYANYFVKYITAMKAQGITIWAITPQNEPENPYNEPSMTMTSAEEINFINNNLGLALATAGLSTKIIAYDHNCDDTTYPTQVCNGSSYVDGAAFHLYAGSISALTTVHNATGKNVYFTEQYTSSTGSFSGDFPWHIQNVMIGSTTNWSRTALEWNLATDGSYGPHTSGGCTSCLGAITINSSTSYSRNVSYYIVGQFSKFVQSGAVRINSSSTDGNLSNVAFKNPDGTIALVVYNSGGGNNFTVGFGSYAFSYYLNGSSAATFVWNPASLPVELISFTAEVDQNHHTLLSWNTSQEINFDYFILEKSNDGFTFSAIDTIKGKGNSASILNYTYTDPSASSETIYYRLKQVDLNGSILYSNIISISSLEQGNNDDLVIYPNPSEGNDFRIEWNTNQAEEATLEIYNILGEKVYAKKVSRANNILEGKMFTTLLTNGVYIVQLSNLKKRLIVK